MEPQRKILIFCGAGISAHSGLKTFRDANGLWNNYSTDEVCNILTLEKNKEKVFEFYRQRKLEVLNAKPNEAHLAIAQLQKEYGADHVHIYTSNIDNLLQRAGCLDVFHVHGDIHGMLCLQCRHTWHIGQQLYDISWKCPACKSATIKPSIIFFNEPAPGYKPLSGAFESAGVVRNGKLVPPIKLFIGSSFKVIKPHIFRPGRGRSIVIDPHPSLGPAAREFEKVIALNAIEGLREAKHLIAQWYADE